MSVEKRWFEDYWREDVIRHIDEYCIYEPKEPMHGKAPGSVYHSQFYLASAFMDPLVVNDICSSFDYLVKANDIDPKEIQICGRHWSALPLLGALATHYGRTLDLAKPNFFSIRGERKNYGRNNVFEGWPTPHRPCLIVDDLANSTNSFAYCKSILEAHRIPVLDKCFAVLNKKNSTDPTERWDKYSQQEIISIAHRNSTSIDEKTTDRLTTALHQRTMPVQSGSGDSVQSKHAERQDAEQRT